MSPLSPAYFAFAVAFRAREVLEIRRGRTFRVELLFFFARHDAEVLLSENVRDHLKGKTNVELA